VPGMMDRPRFTLHSALTAWQWGPFALLVLAGLLAVGWWYLRADWRLAERGRRWPGRRRWAFLAGLVAVDVALQSPVSTFTADYFQAHIVQHLLLMVVAPPLLALGAPSTLLLQTSSRATKTRWLAILRSRPFAVLTHPLTVGLLYFGSMFAFFLTPLIGFAMTHMALMDAINLFFLFGSCTYWWPLVGIDPIVHWKMGHGARMAATLIGGPIETVLALAIMSEHTPIAPMYTVAGTQAGGGLLWGITELAMVAAFVPMFVQWLRSEARRTARDDARADRLQAAHAAAGDPGAGGSASTAPADAAKPARPLSAWEAEWLARTGAVPGQAAAAPAES
jgi:putative membrane protein